MVLVEQIALEFAFDRPGDEPAQTPITDMALDPRGEGLLDADEPLCDSHASNPAAVGIWLQPFRVSEWVAWGSNPAPAD